MNANSGILRRCILRQRGCCVSTSIWYDNEPVSGPNAARYAVNTGLSRPASLWAGMMMAHRVRHRLPRPVNTKITCSVYRAALPPASQRCDARKVHVICKFQKKQDMLPALCDQIMHMRNVYKLANNASLNPSAIRFTTKEDILTPPSPGPVSKRPNRLIQTDCHCVKNDTALAYKNASRRDERAVYILKSIVLSTPTVANLINWRAMVNIHIMR